MSNAIYFACLGISLVFWVLLRRSKLVHVVEYQVGLSFRGNGEIRVLPPGTYRTNPSRDPITIVDMRPYQFLLERLVFQDALRVNAVISLSGQVAVRDPQVAVSMIKNLAEDPVTFAREGLRQMVSRVVVDPNQQERMRLAEKMKSDLNRELEPKGLVLQDLEITELWAESVRLDIPAEVN
jgi:hypothetical protein